ncbi:MAG: PepSY domain-containing protein [Candidatus Angelobacter sp.]
MRLQNLIVCLLLLASSLLAQSKREAPKLTMEQAKKIALEKEPGTLQSKELEKEHGKLIYSFDIRTASGIHEVNVDAMSGNVIEDKVETPADEAKEKQQDSKKAKQKPQAPPQ